MKDTMSKIAERKIQEAIESGEMDNLPGRGKPLNLDVDDHVPEDMRAAYKILKNAGVLPEEMNLRNDIAILEEMLKKAVSEQEEKVLKMKLVEKRLHYSIFMERRRK